MPRWPGYVKSEETKQKIRETLLKTYAEKPELKINSGQFQKGQKSHTEGAHLSLETKQKISLARKGQAPVNKGVPMSDEQKKKVSAGRKGIKSVFKNPEERNRKISEAKKKHIEDSVDCICAACRVPVSPTIIENILIDVLLREFPTVIREKKFGRYKIDAYLPEYHLAFEADGERWHINKTRDENRDASLLKLYNLPVIRFSGKELLAMKNSILI